jgi:hypothetical protein
MKLANRQVMAGRSSLTPGIDRDMQLIRHGSVLGSRAGILLGGRRINCLRENVHSIVMKRRSSRMAICAKPSVSNCGRKSRC